MKLQLRKLFGKSRLFGSRQEGELMRTDRPPLELFNHFKVERFLGSGAFATVYQVRRLRDGRRYALKHLDIQAMPAEDRADLVNEIRLLSSLRHPALLACHEAFVERDQLCIVTELAPGGELAALLRKRADTEDWLPERVVWAYFLQLAVGVQYLHHNHVLHRDLKPQNVLIGEGGRLKIADLGISANLDRVFACRPMGTPQYIAPEMWRRQPYSYSADIWALGCILHEMCSLKPLFLAPTEREVRQKVLSGDVPPLPARYSPALQLLVRRLLEPDVRVRPTIDEVLETPEALARMSLLPPQLRSAAGSQEQAAAPSIKIPKQLWEWQCINLCLPPSNYPTGGESVVEALCARPLEACKLWVVGHGSGARAADTRLRRPSGSGVGDQLLQQQQQQQQQQQAGGLRRRVPSCPVLGLQQVEERRNSVCVAEVLRRRPAAGAAAGGWKPRAQPPAAYALVADDKGLVAQHEQRQEPSTGSGDGSAESGSADSSGSGGAFDGRGPAAPMLRTGRSASDAQLVLMKLEGERLGAAVAAGRGLYNKPFDPTPVEFCNRCSK